MQSMNALIVYGSSKGRTKKMASLVETAFQNANIPVVLKNVFEVEPRELNNYTHIVLGSSTYGQGDLQKDFLYFELGMDSLDLSGIKAAVFGSGNSRYVYFAEAVSILEAKLSMLGARLITPSYKQDMMYESPDGEEVREWALNLAKVVAENK